MIVGVDQEPDGLAADRPDLPHHALARQRRAARVHHDQPGRLLDHRDIALERRVGGDGAVDHVHPVRDRAGAIDEAVDGVRLGQGRRGGPQRQRHAGERDQGGTEPHHYPAPV